MGVVGVMMSSTVGCKDALSNPSIPDGMQSPSTYLSKTGGLGLTKAAVDLFAYESMEFAIVGGILTDEFSIPDNIDVSQAAIDSRTSGQSNTGVYVQLHSLRGLTRLARGVLTKYGSDLSPAIRGQLYAFEGYAELWLADLFCSGVPLSTLDFNSDFTYRPPSTTQQVYEHAVVLFDSALALAADSADVQTLATVGKGRALLALGRYEEAATAVAAVAVNDVYNNHIRLINANGTTNYTALNGVTASDHEGENSIFYRTSGDIRTRSDTISFAYTIPPRRVLYFPTKYSGKVNASSVMTIAGGIEAALIGAEAALNRGQPELWLAALNTLRTTGTYSRIDTTASGAIDTLWNAGSGGVVGLRPLDDPNDANARIDLMFAERAAWLYASGYRQGDLRRLVREYGRRESTVYPAGVYRDGQLFRRYGSVVVLEIPASELMNPYYKGCLSYDA